MIRNILLVTLMLTLIACADNAVRNKIEDLDKSIDNYAYALRWMRKEDAVAFHRRPDGSRPVIDTKMMDVVRVTGFNIKEKTLAADLNGASVTGELSYINNEYGTLKTIEYKQSWWYEPITKKWYVDNDFPQFK